MKNNRKVLATIFSRCLCATLTASMITAGLPALATQSEAFDQLLQDAGLSEVAQAATTYEQELAKFPSSYQVKLQELHNKYPEWIFVAEYLNRDFQTVVDAQNLSTRSTLTAASYWLKSRQSGDYNPATGAYTSRDAGGHVSANELAVSYFLDPRNFLDEINIFQFEALSFNSSYHTLAGVDAILNNTWMDTSTITYRTTSGGTSTIHESYTSAIYKAAQESNASPYYLASKILGEVGSSSPSNSANGMHATYPGVYNLYNIGAYNGSNPIESGLSYANGSGSYLRPWHDPVTAIRGGAQWIANGYINNSAGAQDTLYYQKFDVVQEDTNPYTHQYATSIGYAASAAGTTYYGYADIGLLSSQKIFYIPVYDNMPGQNSQSASVTLSTSSTTGKVSGSSQVTLRQGPTTNSTRLGYLSSGTGVTILEKIRVTPAAYSTFNANPYWYKVQASNGMIGYMSADYITLSNNTITLQPGATYQLGATASSPGTGDISIMSTTDAVATVAPNGLITAHASGTTEIIVTTSGGGFDYVTLQVAPTLANSVSNAAPIATNDQASNGSSGSTTPTPTGPASTVTASSLNVRSGPGLNYGIISTYKSGQQVTVTEVSTDGSWCKTSLGWVSADYLSPYKTATVTGNNVSVYTTASLSGAKVTTLSTGTSLKVFNESTVSGVTWYLTNKGGWVQAQYAGAGDPNLPPAEPIISLPVTVNSDTLNVRSGPGTQYSVVYSYSKGATINALQASGTWVRTEHGWVSTEYLTTESTGMVSGTPNGAGVIVFADAQSGPFKAIPENTNLKLLATQKIGDLTWYLTDQGGWVDGTYITVDVTDTTPTPPVEENPAAYITATTTPTSLNIRSGPSANYSIVGTYAQGTLVDVIETVGTFAQTDRGWVDTTYLTAGEVGTVTGTPNAGGVVVFNDPKSGPFKVAAEGTALKLFATKEVDGLTWYLTDQGGWIDSTYITVGTTPTPDPEPEPEPETPDPTTGEMQYLTTTTTPPSLNIRTGPSTAYPQVGTYAQGSSIQALQSSGSWVRTDRGWIDGAYLHATETGAVAGTPNGAGVIVFSGPKSGPFKVVAEGTELKLYASQVVDGLTWYLTDQGGWIDGTYITVHDPSTAPAPPTSEAVQYLTTTVNTSKLNIRTGPSTGYSIAGTYGQGQTISVLKTTADNWVQTDRGWVSADYLQVSKTGTIAGNPAVVVFNGPFDGPFKAIPEGTQLKLYASQVVNGLTWYLTDQGGWIDGTYINVH